MQELRGEAFTTPRLIGGGWASFKAGVTYERSRITNNYPFSPGRSLGYLRPRLDLRIIGRRSGQFRATIERTISLLDLATFVSNFNFVDNRIAAGNDYDVVFRHDLTQVAASYGFSYGDKRPAGAHDSGDQGNTGGLCEDRAAARVGVASRGPHHWRRAALPESDALCRQRD